MRRFCGNPLNFCRAEIYAGTPLEKRMIALGRARGDYLARVYSLSDPVAALACDLSLDLFESRCWSNGSLMQSSIGLDHLAATLKRFNRRHPKQRSARASASWLRSVNLDTTACSTKSSASAPPPRAATDAGFHRALLALGDRESATRQKLLSAGSNLRAELEALPLPCQAPRTSSVCQRRVSAWRGRLPWPSLPSECPRSPDANPESVKWLPRRSRTLKRLPASVWSRSLVGDVTDPSGRRSCECDDHHYQSRHRSDPHCEDQRTGTLRGWRPQGRSLFRQSRISRFQGRRENWN